MAMRPELGPRRGRAGSAQALAGTRSARYWLLGRLFLDEPGEPMLHELALAMRTLERKKDGTAGALEALESAIAGSLASRRDASLLRAEFARLLPGAPPSGRSHALSPFELTPPDHVGAELRLMSHLCHLEGQAWREGDEAESRRLRERQAHLLDEHLLPWLPALADQFLALAMHSFYRTMPVFVAAACRRDRTVLARLTLRDNRTPGAGRVFPPRPDRRQRALARSMTR